MHFLIYVVNFNVVMFCILFIYIKKSDDVLQGISKLDYLLRVSVFQVYKNEKERLSARDTMSSLEDEHAVFTVVDRKGT